MSARLGECVRVEGANGVQLVGVYSTAATAAERAWLLSSFPPSRQSVVSCGGGAEPPSSARWHHTRDRESLALPFRESRRRLGHTADIFNFVIWSCVFLLDRVTTHRNRLATWNGPLEATRPLLRRLWPLISKIRSSQRILKISSRCRPVWRSCGAKSQKLGTTRLSCLQTHAVTVSIHRTLLPLHALTCYSAKWREPIEKSGLLQYYLDNLAPDSLPTTSSTQLLRAIGNSVADCDDSRAVTLPFLKQIAACLRKEALRTVALSVLYNICLGYRKCPLAANTMADADKDRTCAKGSRSPETRPRSRKVTE